MSQRSLRINRFHTIFHFTIPAFRNRLLNNHLTALIASLFLLSFLLVFSASSSVTASSKAPGDYSPLLDHKSELTSPTATLLSPPTQILTTTPTLAITTTLPISITITLEPTEPSPSPTPSPIQASDPQINSDVSPETWQYIYLPFISVYRIPTTTKLFCNQGSPLNIPDNDPGGIVSNLMVDQPGTVLDINIYMRINHAWPGDLKVSLYQPGSGIRIDLIDRPGVPATSLGCGNDHVQAIFDDAASQPAENKCGAFPAGIAGTFQPANPLSNLNRQWTSGLWKLEVLDLASYDTGSLQKWCLEITSADPSVTPTPSPTPVSLPSSANVSGVTGITQALPLDCESRTAVDWAEFFGFTIPELEFFSRLPKSDNPDKGFVGNVYGEWGNIPPGDYGVHAAPVAALLRNYGVTAKAFQSLHWDDVRFEIAAGRPVMVWITGSTYAGRYPSGAPQYYVSASDQNFTVVTNYEHTVIVTGYTSNSVTIRDGSSVYTRSLNEFLDSWSALRNMAILARP